MGTQATKKATKLGGRGRSAPLTRARIAVRRARVAAGVIAGKTTHQLAAQEGVDVRQIQRDAQAPDTQALIDRALGSQHERLIQGCGLAIERMIQGLDADWKGAPDWRSRGLCARELRELLNMAIGPRPQAPPSPQTGRSIEELLADYQTFVVSSVTVQRGGGAGNAGKRSA